MDWEIGLIYCMFQTEFTEGKRTAYNTFVIKTWVNKYLKAKRDSVGVL